MPLFRAIDIAVEDQEQAESPHTQPDPPRPADGVQKKEWGNGDISANED